jgi:glutamate-1-semialdehyde 2,1-aminomutase
MQSRGCGGSSCSFFAIPAAEIQIMPTAHRGFRRSEELYARARRFVPAGIYGHQTPRMLVEGAYPYFFERGDGARVWDVDGNEYVDYMCSYGPIVLGHNHPAVEAAAAAQRQKGNCFNGPTPLWVDLAERLVSLTPWAAWAAFAKNGSDVCTWAIELAREHTRRTKIVKAKGAYHGTHAWTTPLPAGTTPCDTADVLTFRWNDLDGLERVLRSAAGQVAGIILSPFRHEAFHDQEMPAPGFLQGVRRLCDEQGIVIILDDVRAGFRLDLRGSGAFFGVEPDLSCYCKAIANGYALSACLGREQLRGAAERVFFTGSYFTSGVPMAAALACLRELESNRGVERMNRIGQLLRDGLQRQAEAHRLEIRQSGPPSIPFLTFAADEGRFTRSRRFCAECCRLGVYFHPHHNWFLSAAHGEEDIRVTLEATDEAFAMVRKEFGD